VLPNPTRIYETEHLVGSLFTLPSTQEDWERYRLSDEQVEFFHEYGYLKGIQMLTELDFIHLRCVAEHLCQALH